MYSSLQKRVESIHKNLELRNITIGLLRSFQLGARKILQFTIEDLNFAMNPSRTNTSKNHAWNTMNYPVFSLSPSPSAFVIVLLLFVQVPSSVSNSALFADCSPPQH
ncbi:hypothetical protein POTOM_054084 [Populus tomentosa]|uniref:Uncharacterized protein n=1 Tax=Populus tomentosa TaxID=118781 RepID=A0A8X7XYJ8_POPTO|nr:hypothetical protein POTOM_054084 [Populus tomentosa]